MLFKLFVKDAFRDHVFATEEDGEFEQAMCSTIPAPEFSACEVLFDGALSDGSWLVYIPMVDL